MKKFISCFRKEVRMEKLRVAFNASLHEYDSEEQTYGC